MLLSSVNKRERSLEENERIYLRGVPNNVTASITASTVKAVRQ